MAEYIYCMSNPSVPGVIRVDKSTTEPRQALDELGIRAGNQRIDWVVSVADSDASLTAIREQLSVHADPSWPGHYKAEPMRARAVAIQFTTLRTPEDSGEAEISALPSLVIGLGLSVQFLGMIHGSTGPSAALIASALFWVVYTLPIGTGGRQRA